MDRVVYIGIKHKGYGLFSISSPFVGVFTTKKGVAKFLGVHHNTIARWISDGKMDHNDKSLIVTKLNKDYDYEWMSIKTDNIWNTNSTNQDNSHEEN